MMAVSCSRLLGSCLVIGLLSLSACAHGPREQRAYPQGYYGADYRGAQQFVQYGYVRSIEQLVDGRESRHEGRDQHERSGSSGAGAVVGGVIGGVVGNQMGRGEGRAAATVIGAVAGAVIGNEIERQEGRREERRVQVRYRVWVRLEGAGEQAFDFERLDGLRVGERVRVIDGRLQRW
ncbi:glycine zipper 2TM domain-containing protein [Paucibacter soli]|uniref:glycine zipper 2TM domain-containing protein n=1 Tax=Paucibacter soli TaxID=3133433 RepID=UPI0030B187B0